MKKDTRTLEQIKKDIDVMGTRLQIAELAQKRVAQIAQDFFEKKKDDDNNFLFDENGDFILDYDKPTSTWWISSNLETEEIANMALELQNKINDMLMEWVRG